MAKSKPAAKKTAKKSTKKTETGNRKMQSLSARITLLLFVFLIALTVGTLLYQKGLPASESKKLQSSVLNYADLSQEDKDDKSFMFALKFLATKGVVLGYKDNTLKPDNPVNRAEFIKMLTIALKADVTNSGNKACFADVAGTEWFAQYICYAKDAGWISGFAGGKVLPGNQISLAEASKIIATAQQWDPKQFATFPNPKSKNFIATAWYAPFVKTAFWKNIYPKYITYDENTLDPMYLLTRRDVIMMMFMGTLLDTLKVEKYEDKYIPDLFAAAGIAMSDSAAAPAVSAPASAKK